MLRTVFVGAMVCLGFAVAPKLQAQTPIERADTWLRAQIQANGTVVGETSAVANAQQVRAEVAHALQETGAVPPALATALEAQADRNSELLARLLLTETSSAPTTQVNALKARQNADGGIGAANGYSSNAIDTAFTLLAFRKAAVSAGPSQQGAAGYLLSKQNADGSFGQADTVRKAITTGLALEALAAYAANYSYPTAIQRARSALIALQEGGSYTDTLSGAHAIIALASSGPDPSSYTQALTTLKAAQGADGSWGGDAYTTAVALRALIIAGNPPSPPTTGSLRVRVVDAITRVGLSGVALVAQREATTANATTDNTGSAMFTSLAPGNYQVTATRTGYQNASANVTISAGSIAEIPELRMSPLATGAVLRGQIRDAASNDPLAGVSVALSGSNTATMLSDSAGNYQFVGLAPGAMTVELTKAGYQGITQQITVGANQIIQFNPSLYATGGNPPVSASLRAVVLNGSDLSPVVGALVQVGSQSMLTDATGHFELTNLATGPIQATVSADQYESLNLSATLSAGVNNAGRILLSPSTQPTTLTLRGVIRSAAPGQAVIGGASIRVVNTTLNGQSAADGRFQIAGIASLSFQIQINAPGYTEQRYAVNAANFGVVDGEFVLTPLVANGLAFDELAITPQSVEPFEEMTAQSAIRNSGSTTVRAQFALSITDAVGNSVAEIPLITLMEGQNPNDAFLDLTPNSTTPIAIEWYPLNAAGGTYTATLRCYGVSGQLLAERAASFVVNAKAQIGGVLSLDPPIAISDSQVPVNIQAKISNQGNIPVPSGNYELKVKVIVAEGASVSNTPNVQLHYRGSVLDNVTLRAMTRDGAGNALVVSSDRKIFKVTPEGVASLLATSPTTLPGCGTLGGAVDLYAHTDGTVIIASSNCLYRLKADLTFQAISPITAGTQHIAVNAQGEVYVLKTAEITKIVPGQAEQVVHRSTLNAPWGLARNSNGEFLISNIGDGTVAKLSGNAVSQFANTITSARGIAVDNSDNTYVISATSDNVVKILPNGTKSVLAFGFSDPMDIASDNSGLYLTDRATKAIIKIDPSTGGKTTVAQGLAFTSLSAKYDQNGVLFILNSNEIATHGVNGERSSIPVLNGVDLEFLADSSLLVSTPSGLRKITGNTVTSALTVQNNALGGITQMPTGEVYIGSVSTADIYQYSASTSSLTGLLKNHIQSPTQLRLTSGGELLIANQNNIVKIPSTATAVALTPDLPTVIGLNTTSTGETLVGMFGEIRRIDALGQITTVASGLGTWIYSIVQSGSEFYYVTFNRNIYKIAADGTSSTVFVNPNSGSFNSLVGIGSERYALESGGRIWKFVDGQANPTAPLCTGLFARDMALGADGKLYLAVSNRLIRLDPQGCTQQTVVTLAANESVYSGTVLGDGRYALLDAARKRVYFYDSQGVLIDHYSNFDRPTDLQAFNGELWFTDKDSLYAVGADLRPRLKASIGSGRHMLGVRAGELYFLSAAQVKKYSPSGATTVFTARRNAPIQALAFDSGASQRSALVTTSNEVYELDGSWQTSRFYPGLGTLGAIGIDAMGRILVSDHSSQQLIRFNVGATDAEYVAVDNNSSTDMSFDSQGRVLLAGSSIVRMDLDWIPSILASGVSANGVIEAGGAVYWTERFASRLRRLSNGVTTTLARGATNVTDIEFADGKIWVSDQSGALFTLSEGGLELSEFDVNRADRLARLPAGGLAIFSNYYELNLLQGGQMSAPYELAGANSIDDLFANNANEFVSLNIIGNAGTLYKITLTSSTSALPPGTVVYQTERQLPDLAVGGAAVDKDFGEFVPPQAGDYSVEITSTSAQVQGTLYSDLHIGPHADGLLAINRTRVAPVSANIRADFSIRGLDDTVIAVPQTSAMSASPMPTTAYPIAFGIDSQARMIVATTAEVARVSFAPSGSTYQTLATLTIGNHGTLPVDAEDNVFVGSGVDLKKVTAAGVVSTVASFPQAIKSLARLKQGEIVVATVNELWRVQPDGTGKRRISGIQSPFSITTDAADNIYVQLSIALPATSNRPQHHPVIRYKLDGSSQSVLAEAHFENEGANIAGDCAQNLFVAPLTWARVGQSGEEHIIGQRNGRSGFVGAMLDTRLINPAYADLDTMVFDRFSSTLSIWNHGSGPSNVLLRIPIVCGGITTALHAILPAGQDLGLTEPLPTQQVSRPDGSRELVWQLNNVGSLARQVVVNTTLNNLRLGQRRPVFTEAYLVFRNPFQTGRDIRLPVSIPEVDVGNIVEPSLSLDATSYPQQAPVAVNLSLANTDTVDVSGRLLVEVLDAQDVVAKVLLDEPAQINAGQTLIRTPNFNTESMFAGGYKVRARLLATGNNPVELARISRDFVVTVGTGQGPLVQTSVTTDKANYQPNDRVNLTVKVINQTRNQVLEQLTSETVVRDPEANVVQRFEQTGISLIPQAFRQLEYSVSLRSAAAGGYTVQQTVRAADTSVVATSSASFAVQSSVGSLNGLRGSVQAPTSVEAGTTAVFSASLTNIGNAELVNVPVQLALVDANQARVLAQWDAPRTISTTAATQFSENWDSFGTAPGRYQLVLRAGDNGNMTDLAQTEVAVVAPTVAYEQSPSVPRETRVLVLVSCPGNVDEASCTRSRMTQLSQHLSAQGLVHSVVSTEQNFASEFRSGRFNTYWLAGGAAKLRGRLPANPQIFLRNGFEYEGESSSILSELTEAVERGDSLWLDGPHNPLNFEVLEMLGASYVGTSAQTAVNLLPIAYQQGTFNSVGAAVRYQVNGATLLAQFADASPAIVERQFGAGRVLLMAFDMLSAMQNPNATGITPAQVIDQSLVRLLPGLRTHYVPADVVRVVNTITNQNAAAQNTEIKLSLPVGADALTVSPSGYTRSGTLASGFVFTWRSMLPSLAPQRFEALLRLPTASAPDTVVRTRISNVRAGNQVIPHSETDVALPMFGDNQAVESLRDELQALALTSVFEQARRSAAVSALAAGWAALQQHHYVAAFAGLTTAGRELRQITSLPLADAQYRLASLLAMAQHPWAARLPLCEPENIMQTVPAEDFRAIAPAHGFDLRGGSQIAIASNWEAAVGANVLSSALSNQAQFVWVNERTYRFELDIAASGSGSLVLKDGSNTVLTANYPGGNAPMRLGNALQLVLQNLDDTGSVLRVQLDSVNGQPSAVVLSNPPNQTTGNVFVATHSAYLGSLNDGFQARGTIQFRFAGSAPPEQDSVSLQVLPGHTACLSPFANGRN